MNIIIAGVGQVGFRLALMLSKNHNIIIIDKNGEALEFLSESIDVLAIVGNIENPETYKNIGSFIPVSILPISKCALI